MLLAIIFALLLAWMFAAVFENGPNWPGFLMVAAVLWAVIDRSLA